MKRWDYFSFLVCLCFALPTLYVDIFFGCKSLRICSRWWCLDPTWMKPVSSQEAMEDRLGASFQQAPSKVLSGDQTRCFLFILMTFVSFRSSYLMILVAISYLIVKKMTLCTVPRQTWFEVAHCSIHCLFSLSCQKQAALSLARDLSVLLNALKELQAAH